MKNVSRSRAVVILGIVVLVIGAIAHSNHQKQSGLLACSYSYTSQIQIAPSITTNDSNSYSDLIHVTNHPVSFTPPAGYQISGVPGTFSGGAVSTLVPTDGAWGPNPPSAYQYALSQASVLAKDNNIAMRFMYKGQWTIAPNNPLSLKCSGGTWVAEDGVCQVLSGGRLINWPCLHTTPKTQSSV
jgi:hypothetical protein